MSACSEVTLCDPTDPTIKVKVTDPGTVDAAGIQLPAGTPYGGDLAALVKCCEPDGSSVECGWLEYVPEDTTVTFINGDPADKSSWLFETASGFAAVLVIDSNGNGFFADPIAAGNANGAIVNAGFSTAGEIYDYHFSNISLPKVSTAQGCKAKIASQLTIFDLDVRSTIRGESSFGSSFPLPTADFGQVPFIAEGQHNNGDFEPTYPAFIDTPTLFDLQSVFPNNVAGGLALASGSTTELNSIVGQIESNGAGVNDSIAFQVRIWVAQPVDIHKDCSGEVTLIEDADGNDITATASLAYDATDCF